MLMLLFGLRLRSSRQSAFDYTSSHHCNMLWPASSNSAWSAERRALFKNAVQNTSVGSIEVVVNFVNLQTPRFSNCKRIWRGDRIDGSRRLDAREHPISGRER